MLKISLITPTFNQGKYIEKTIQSVLNQNYPNLEYIIIDGGSNDNTIDIIKKYEKHLAYWVSEPDKGQSDAINKGISQATGDIINWINSDDWIEENSLFHVASAFANPNIDIYCGYGKLIFDSKTISKRTSIISEPIAKAISSLYIMQPATFWRKKIFDEFIPIENSLHYMMDFYHFIKYIATYGWDRISYSDIIIANVLMHDNAKSFKDIKKFLDEQNKIYFGLFNNSATYPTKKMLPIKLKNEKIYTELKEIEYRYWRWILFYFDQFGNRKGINLKALLKLLFKYPFPFFKNIFYISN